MKSDNEDNKASEPQPAYNTRIIITSLANLEERDRELTRNMTHNERMEYLQKLISITYSDEDLKKLEKKFNEGRIEIRKQE
jgi:hypothetical protein